MTKLVSLTACDDQGARVLDDDAVRMLQGKNCAPVRRLFRRAMRLSGLTEEMRADEEKKSGEAPGSASPTDSPPG